MGERPQVRALAGLFLDPIRFSTDELAVCVEDENVKVTRVIEINRYCYHEVALD